MGIATDVILRNAGVQIASPTDRVEGLASSDYALLKRAVELKGCSITDFVADAAQDAAQRVIEEDGVIRLPAEDQGRFARALLNPPAPNAALERAMRRHVKKVEMR